MPNKETEGRFVYPLTIGALLAIGILHWAFWPEHIILLKDITYMVFYLFGMFVVAISSFISIAMRHNPNYDGWRWAVAIVAAGVCIWIGIWCSQYREDSKKGIEYKYEKS